MLARFSGAVVALILFLGSAQAGGNTANCPDAPRPAKPACEHPVLKSLGHRLVIAAVADSLENLIKKVHPTFVWAGRDMVWIEKDEKGRTRFILDRAFLFQPDGAAPQWVLLNERKAPYDESYAQLTGEYFHAVADLRDKSPVDGEAGTYAVVVAVHPRFGTVYEVGWPGLVGGNGHWEHERRLYFLNDRADHWQFLGEGWQVSHGKAGVRIAGSTEVTPKIVWPDEGNTALKILLTIRNSDVELEAEGDPEDFVHRRDLNIRRDAMLEAPFPSEMKAISRRYYLPGPGESLNELVWDLASWQDSWETGTPADRRQTRSVWRKALLRLNPCLRYINPCPSCCEKDELPAGEKIFLLEENEYYRQDSPHKNCPINVAVTCDSKPYGRYQQAMADIQVEMFRAEQMHREGKLVMDGQSVVRTLNTLRCTRRELLTRLSKDECKSCASGG